MDLQTVRNQLLRAPNSSMTSRLGSSLTKGWKWGKEGTLLSLPFIAYEAATAPRGELAPTVAARVVGMGTFPILTAGLSVALVAMIPGIGVPAATVLAGVLALYPNSAIEESLLHGTRTFTQFDRQRRRLQMGGDYQDTQSNALLRMRAVQDMSATHQASRRFLGQEARFFSQL